MTDRQHLPPPAHPQDELDEILETMACTDCTGYPVREHAAAKAALLAYVDRQRADELIKLRGASSIDDGYVRMPEILEARLRGLVDNQQTN